MEVAGVSHPAGPRPGLAGACPSSETANKAWPAARDVTLHHEAVDRSKRWSCDPGSAVAKIYFMNFEVRSMNCKVYFTLHSLTLL